MTAEPSPEMSPAPSPEPALEPSITLPNVPYIAQLVQTMDEQRELEDRLAETEPMSTAYVGALLTRAAEPNFAALRQVVLLTPDNWDDPENEFARIVDGLRMAPTVWHIRSYIRQLVVTDPPPAEAVYRLPQRELAPSTVASLEILLWYYRRDRSSNRAFSRLQVARLMAKPELRPALLRAAYELNQFDLVASIWQEYLRIAATATA